MQIWPAYAVMPAQSVFQTEFLAAVEGKNGPVELKFYKGETLRLGP